MMMMMMMTKTTLPKRKRQRTSYCLNSSRPCFCSYEPVVAGVDKTKTWCGWWNLARTIIITSMIMGNVLLRLEWVSLHFGSSSGLLFVDAKSSSSSSTSSHQKSLPLDPYRVLGVTPPTKSKATLFLGKNQKDDESEEEILLTKEIKRNYRLLCLKYHPDKNRASSYNHNDTTTTSTTMNKKKKMKNQPKQDQQQQKQPSLEMYERKFKQIQAAYELIGTAKARRQYHERNRLNWFQQQSTTTNPYQQQQSQQQTSSHYTQTSSSSSSSPYEELIRQMFAQQQQQYASQTNPSTFFTSRHGGRSSTFASYYSTKNHNYHSYHPVHNLFSTLQQSYQQQSGYQPSSSSSPTVLNVKSTYLFRISVPLATLYKGYKQYKVIPKQSSSSTTTTMTMPWGYKILYHSNFFMNVWQRYTAAFRGGIGYIALYQAILYALPFLRISTYLSLIIALYIWDRSVPVFSLYHNKHNNLSLDRGTTTTSTTTTEKEETKDDYTFDILPGYKGGTKFTFHDVDKRINDNNNDYGNEDIKATPGYVDVIFQLKEQSHKIYQRIGNDLHASITVTESNANHGCIIELEPLLVISHPKNPTSTTTSGHSFHNNNNIPLDNESTNPHCTPIQVHVPPGTRSGDIIRLKGYGWPIRQQQQRRATSTSNNNNNDDNSTNHQSSDPISSLSLFGDLLVTVQIKNTSPKVSFLRWQRKMKRFIFDSSPGTTTSTSTRTTSNNPPLRNNDDSIHKKKKKKYKQGKKKK